MDEGEFWLDETEFLSQFDDVTVGYPISSEGHLKSIYTGNSLLLIKNVGNLRVTDCNILGALIYLENLPHRQEIC